jgi:predicted Rossmann fold nucleotide-binding protein DprA/Smf involved in DNA uptake
MVILIKRVVIAGCRDYNNYDEAKLYIDFCLSNIRRENDIVIVSGCASGADAIGERYARQNGFKVEKYPANWEKYGRGAGPIRNKQMAQACDYVICFWDGKSRGTKSMIEFAREYNKPVKIKKICAENNYLY